MFRPNNFETSRRRAVILMVVLVLLTLFAIVGLAFVLYANAEANSSRVYREAFTTQDNRIDIDANVLANFSMSQVLFDVPEPTSANSPNLNSAIRGHSLGRDMYGWNTDLLGSNVYAFNGVGRLHDTSSNTFGVDDHALLSYVPYPAFGYIRDPERVGTRANFGAALAAWTGGWHPGYTYPDGNHVFLGAFDADGNVVARSFVRPYLLPKTSQGNPCLPLDPTSPGYWTWFADVNPNNPADTVPIDPATKLSYLRYYSLRPRNADMAQGFPYPGPGGDVRNLPPSGGLIQQNDSIWVDLDYPVQQAADGTYFKPLFAFFIADLDGRININTAGNVRNTTVNPNTHLSNQGWGTWEVNPAYLSAGTTDWPQMLVGNANAPTVTPRYGADQQPSSAGSVAASGQSPRVYAPVDYDGSDESGANQVGGIATGKYVLPSEVTPATNYASFPYFPKGYNNGFQPERTNHPGIYDSQYPGGDDRRFNANQHLLQLYNGGPSSTAALGTDLGKLLSTTLNPQLNQTAFRVRNMITTDSADRFVPGLTPWIYDRTATSKTNSYGYGGAGVSTQAPNGSAVAFPALSQRPVPPNVLPASTEFTADWKSIDATIGSVDLNRFLPPYPHLGQGTTPATYSTTPLTTVYGRFDDNGPIQAQFVAAQQARQQLADDIYRRLLRVTGVLAPVAPGSPTAAELAPRRWLAQLAVNIVDFIDEDEISTPFNFYTAADANGAMGFNAGLANGMGTTSTGTATDQSPSYWVIGTELPKVVVNEVLAEYTPTAANLTPFNVNVFVELFNPMPSAAQTGGTFPATVQQQDSPTNPVPLWMGASATGAAYAPYQVILADSTRDVTATPIQAGLFVPQNTNDNVLGTPNVERAVPVDADFGSATAVKTIDGAATTATIAPQQYFLMTPGGADNNKTFAVQKMGTNGVVPTGTPTVTSPNLTYKAQMNAAGTQMQLPNGTNITDGPTPAGTQSTGITVLLRRLANPHMPPDLNPASATYNPYVTSDYMTNVALQNTNNAEVSTAKGQPYGGSPTAYYNQAVGAAGTTTDTFGQVNNATAVFDWLVHLDRQLISPMELLNVSGYHPHELTYQFLPKTGWRYGHQTDWYTETNRLYRAFEFLGTRSRAGGVSGLGGRQPGKVNINAVWNKEVLEALADPQTGNSFTQAQVDTIFTQMMALRSPGYAAGPPVTGGVSGKDRPFLSMGVGNMPTTDTIGGVFDDGTAKPSNTGIEDTLLRSNGAGGRLFDVTTANHPYRQTELMTKLYNNLTTRSNTFAVWVTVGFFRVPTVNGQPQYVDNQANGPVKLAEEIGFATGTNIRHRIFTVVDRTRLTLGTSAQPVTTLGAAVAQLNQPTQVTVAAASGTAGQNAIPWTIQAGTVLDIDVGTASEETVVVQQVANTTITATFTKAHANGAAVQIPGNPGPQTNWTVNSATAYKGLVLTYTVMQ